MDELILEAGRQDRHYWLDLWRYRELFQVLAWRDLSVRYKQTAIGIIWALLRPVLTVLIFTVVFGHLAKLPSDGDTPYSLMVFAGITSFNQFQHFYLTRGQWFRQKFRCRPGRTGVLFKYRQQVCDVLFLNLP